MALIGEGVARAFATFPPLDAYRSTSSAACWASSRSPRSRSCGRRRVAWGIVVGASSRAALRQRRLAAAAGRAAVRRAVVVLASSRSAPARQLVAVLQGRTTSTGSRRGAAHSDIDVNGVPHQCDPVGRVRAGEEPSYYRAVRATSGQEARQRADRRRRHRQRRRDRAVQGRQARRRGRDRPAAPASSARSSTRTTRTRTRGSASTSTTAARSCEQHRHEVRPDPVRAARLADPRVRASRAAAGELPVHPAGDARRPATISSPAARSRCTTTTARPG